MDLQDERNELYEGILDQISSFINLLEENFSEEPYSKAAEELRDTYVSFKDLQFEWLRDNNVIHQINQDLSLDPNNTDFDVSSMIEKYREEYAEDGGENEEKLPEENATGFGQIEEEAEEDQYEPSMIAVYRKRYLDDDGESEESMSEENAEAEEAHFVFNPTSEQVITNPVKNRFCDHVYDLENITALLNANEGAEIKCPYESCANNVPLSLDHLMQDKMSTDEETEDAINTITNILKKVVLDDPEPTSSFEDQ